MLASHGLLPIRVDRTAACTYASNARSESLRDNTSQFRLGAKDFG